MQTVLRMWFLATAVVLAGAMIWAFVPVLVPVLGLTAVIGGLVAVIVAFARWLERRRGARGGD
ncbi:MAG: hypothetical protein R3D44_08720 [Hyphomicrobiaceae bacterium]